MAAAGAAQHTMAAVYSQEFRIVAAAVVTDPQLHHHRDAQRGAAEETHPSRYALK